MHFSISERFVNTEKSARSYRMKRIFNFDSIAAWGFYSLKDTQQIVTNMDNTQTHINQRLTRGDDSTQVPKKRRADEINGAVQSSKVQRNAGENKRYPDYCKTMIIKGTVDTLTSEISFWQIVGGLNVRLKGVVQQCRQNIRWRHSCDAYHVSCRVTLPALNVQFILVNLCRTFSS